MLSQRGRLLKPSPTLVLAARAKELKADGQDVISLSVGEPDWDTPQEIKDKAIEAISSGETKYTPAAGTVNLRKAITRSLQKDYGFSYSAVDEVTVATGAKYILFAALQTVLDVNDEVIIPAPYWVSYPDMVEISGGKAVIVTCGEGSGFKLTSGDLKRYINEKTKIVMLNSPSNPTGEVYSREELMGLAEVLRENPHVYVISDDIYSRLVFDQNIADHILVVAPDLRNRVLMVNGASKSYSMTGWRMGWAAGPKTWIKAMASFQSQSTGCPCSISQVAAQEALDHGDSHIMKAINLLRERRDFAVNNLNVIEGLQTKIPPGAFYIWLNIESLIGKSYGNRVIKSSRDFCQLLLDEKMVVVVPGLDFGLEGYLRMSYALEKKRMAEAIARIKDFVGSIV